MCRQRIVNYIAFWSLRHCLLMISTISPKVLEHLQHFIDCLIYTPFSPRKVLIYAGYTRTTLVNYPQQTTKQSIESQLNGLYIKKRPNSQTMLKTGYHEINVTHLLWENKISLYNNLMLLGCTDNIIETVIPCFQLHKFPQSIECHEKSS